MDTCAICNLRRPSLGLDPALDACASCAQAIRHELEHVAEIAREAQRLSKRMENDFTLAGLVKYVERAAVLTGKAELARKSIAKLRNFRRTKTGAAIWTALADVIQVYGHSNPELVVPRCELAVGLALEQMRLLDASERRRCVAKTRTQLARIAAWSDEDSRATLARLVQSLEPARIEESGSNAKHVRTEATPRPRDEPQSRAQDAVDGSLATASKKAIQGVPLGDSSNSGNNMIELTCRLFDAAVKLVGDDEMALFQEHYAKTLLVVALLECGYTVREGAHENTSDWLISRRNGALHTEKAQRGTTRSDIRVHDPEAGIELKVFAEFGSKDAIQRDQLIKDLRSVSAGKATFLLLLLPRKLFDDATGNKSDNRGAKPKSNLQSLFPNTVDVGTDHATEHEGLLDTDRFAIRAQRVVTNFCAHRERIVLLFAKGAKCGSGLLEQTDGRARRAAQ